MLLRDLTDDRITWVYQNWMMQDFPDDERKPLARIRSALRDGDYRCIGIFEAEALVGYAFFAGAPAKRNAVLLDYFAIAPENRNRGLGGMFLQRLPELFPQAAAVMIETEAPETAANAAEQDLRQRRLAFYLRSGCEDSGVQADVFGVRFRLLSYPVRLHPDAEQIWADYCAVYRNMLPESMFLRHIARAAL